MKVRKLRIYNVTVLFKTKNTNTVQFSNIGFCLDRNTL